MTTKTSRPVVRAIKRFIAAKFLCEEISSLEKMLIKLEQTYTSNKFLIEQGKKYVQMQVNNPKAKNVSRSLMGNGLVHGAKQLGVSEKYLDRQIRHEMRVSDKTLKDLNSHHIDYFEFYQKIGFEDVSDCWKGVYP